MPPPSRPGSGLEDIQARDLLALFAFVRPAHFCLPTVRGLCEALDLNVPTTPEEEVTALPEIARALIDELEDMAALASPEMKDTALAMARGQWEWGDIVLAALGVSQSAGTKRSRPGAGLDVWKSLPVWEEPPPAPPPGSEPVEPREARLRLAQLVSAGSNIAEARPTQSDYASAASQAFAPRIGRGQAAMSYWSRPALVSARLWDMSRRRASGQRKNGAPVLDRDLHAQPPAPDRQRTRPPASRQRREAPPRGDPEGPRELSLSAELPGSGHADRAGARERRRPRLCWRAGRWPAAMAT